MSSNKILSCTLIVFWPEHMIRSGRWLGDRHFQIIDSIEMITKLTSTRTYLTLRAWLKPKM